MDQTIGIQRPQTFPTLVLIQLSICTKHRASSKTGEKGTANRKEVPPLEHVPRDGRKNRHNQAGIKSRPSRRATPGQSQTSVHRPAAMSRQTSSSTSITRSVLRMPM